MKIGIIGCGLRVGHFVAKTMNEYDPDFRVVGIVDPDVEGVKTRLREADREAKFFADPEAMIHEVKPDALMIGTRCNLHAPLAVAVAKHRIPTFLEKPVAISMEQAIELERAYAELPNQVLVSFPLRYTSLHQRAKELISGGALGEVIHVTGLNYVPYGTVYYERGYRDFEVTRGLFLQKATHDFDYLMDLEGSPIVSISANWSRGRVFGGDKSPELHCAQCPEAEVCRESPRNRRRNGSGGVLEDHLCVFSSACGNDADGMNEEASNAIFRFADGAIGAYTQVVFTRREGIRGPIITGTEGRLSFDWYKGVLHHVEHHAPFTSDTTVSGGAAHFGGDIELAKNFFDMVRYGHAPQTPLADGLRSVYTCLAAVEAAASGREVAVRQIER